VPVGATVTLEADLCACALVPVAAGLPGLILRYNEGVAYGQADAVDGWTLLAAAGTPEPELFPGGETAAGIAYDAPYRYRLGHAGGVEAEVTATITADRRVILSQMGWITGCP
jgi:hypothetical protein